MKEEEREVIKAAREWVSTQRYSRGAIPTTHLGVALCKAVLALDTSEQPPLEEVIQYGLNAWHDLNEEWARGVGSAPGDLAEYIAQRLREAGLVKDASEVTL